MERFGVGLRVVELIEMRFGCYLDLFPEYRTSVVARRTDGTHRETGTSLVSGTFMRDCVVVSFESSLIAL